MVDVFKNNKSTVEWLKSTYKWNEFVLIHNTIRSKNIILSYTIDVYYSYYGKINRLI